MPVVAAGAILWRKEKDSLKVLLIHRGRYDDWSWPKGKLDKGEGISEAAVREIKEETGLKIALGPKLFESKYILANGSKKIVHYWSAKVTDSALKKQKFTPDDEVSSFKWVTVSEARKLLSYEHDNDPLDALVKLEESNSLDTRSVIILRHAKATPRDQWKKGEATRPLLPLGLIQAATLATTLKAYSPKLVVTSSWKRCMDTVLPYLNKHKSKLLERSQLSELGAKNGPKRTIKLIHKLMDTGKSVVICSHRPALPTIVEGLGSYGDKSQRKELEAVLGMEPAQMFVLHITKNKGKKKGKIVAIESIAPAFGDQSLYMTNAPQNWLDWKQSRNRVFSNPTGFLAITNLVWLTAEPQEISGISGSWYSDESSVHVIDSSSGEHSWNLDKLGDTSFQFDGILVELANRSGSPIVRPRDPNSDMLKAFSGVKTFAYDPAFDVTATLERSSAPQEVVVGSVVEGLTHAYVSPGVLSFELDGNIYRLTAFEQAGINDLTVYFKDATSGKSTYGTGRSVTAKHQNDGTYSLDFNFSTNFFCAYTDFATCPVAPVENNLLVAIEAGESLPDTRITADGIKEQVAK